MTARRLSTALALAALPALLALGACSSATAGHGSNAGAPVTLGGTGTAPASGAGTPTDAAHLGALMEAGAASIQSAHITLDISVAGQTITGAGDEKLSGGQLSGLDLSENIPGAGEIRILIINDKTYAMLPSSLNTSGKPWVLVSASSSNSVIQQLASSIDSAKSSASLGSVSAFVVAAKSVKLDGAEPIAGVPATHYSVVVDVTRLPASYPGRDALTGAGLSTLPVELWIDAQGRPVQVTEELSVQGQTVSTKISVTKYNVPVTITAPPANQVSTR